MVRRIVWLPIAIALSVVWYSALKSTVPVGASPSTLTFTVNSTGDAHAAPPLNDGICRTALDNTVCTLRAAVEKANYSPPGTIVRLDGLPPPVTYTLSLGQLVISNTMTLLGAGPAGTVVDGNGAVTGQRVLYIITHTVSISGVTMMNGRNMYTGIDPNAFAGGILHNDALTLTNSVVSHNSAIASSGAAYGGGIYSSGKLTLINSVVSNNLVTTTVGGIASGGGIVGNPTLINSIVSGNTARDSGGGIYGGGTIINSTLSGNTAGNGGAIYGGSLTLINSTISGNSAQSYGGGIYHSGGTAGLYNVTIAGNTANKKFSGSGYGGGIYNASGAVNFQNTILAYNVYISLFNGFPLANPEDCWGALASQGYNIVSETTDCTISGSYIVAGPSLGVLQNNGGPTWTQALMPGSRGIDEGQPGNCTDNLGAPLTTDQRGYMRPVKGAGTLRCDIGAYEVQRPLFLPIIMR